MRRHRNHLFAASLLTSLAAAAVLATGTWGDGPVPANNKTTNPSFESNLTGWTVNGAALTRPTAGDAPHGGRVAKLVSNNTSDFSLDDTPDSIASSIADETYAAKAYVKAGGTINNDKPVGISIREFDGNGNVVGYVDEYVTLSNTAYTEVEIGYTAVGSGNDIGVHFWRGSEVTNGEILYADAITLSPTVIPPNNKTSNPSFETELSGWVASGSTLTRPTNAVAPHGGRVAQVVSNNTTSYELDDDPNVIASSTAGETYTGEAYVKAGSSANSGKPAVLEVREWDGTTWVGQAQQSVTLSDGAFTKTQVEYTAVGDGNDISVRLYRSSQVTNGEILLADAISLAPGVLPPYNRMPNGSFEENKNGWDAWPSGLTRRAVGDAPHGTRVVETTADSTNGYGANAWPPTITHTYAGERYTGRVHLKAGGASADGEPVTIVLREWEDSNVVAYDETDVTLSDSGWVEGEIEHQATGDGNRIDFAFFKTADVTAGESFLLDAVSISTDAIPLQNRTANPSFETISGWTAEQGSAVPVTDAAAPHGSRAMEVTATGTDPYSLRGSTPPVTASEAGERYSARAYFKAGGASNDNMPAQLAISEWDGPNLVDEHIEQVTAQEDHYVKAETDYIAQDSGNMIRVSVGRESQVSAGEVLVVDAVSLVHNLVSQENATANPSFESNLDAWDWGDSMSRVAHEAAPHGRFVAKLTSTGTDSAGIDDTPASITSSDSGRTYTARAWVRAGSSANDGEEINIGMREWNSEGLVDYAEASTELTDDGYLELDVDYTAVGEDNEIDLRVWRNDDVASGEVVFLDAITLTPGPATATPTISNVEVDGLTGWRDGGQGSIEVDVDAPQGGTRALLLELPGGQELEHQFDCEPACPTTASHEFQIEIDEFPEGVGTATLTAVGANPAQVDTENLELKIDHTAPAIEVSGALAGDGSSGSKMTVNADDGDRDDPSTARSGIKSVEILIDGEQEAYVEQSCPDPLGSCSLEEPLAYQVDLAELSAGEHEFQVVAEDQVGHEEVQTWRATAEGESPVLAYSFEGGSARDSMGEPGHDGRIHGATFTSDGRFGDALTFDGVDDRVTVQGTSALDLTDGFTLEAWVNPDELEDEMSVLTKENSDTSDPYAYLLHASSSAGPPVGSIGHGDQTETSVDGTASLPLDNWSHLALIYDGAQTKLCLNGSVVATTNSAPPQSSDGDLQLGGDTFLGAFFDGRIDEVRIYQEAISAGQLAADIQSPIEPTDTPQPAAAFSFENTTVRDITGNSGDGQLHGATFTSDGKHGDALEFDGEDDRVSVDTMSALQQTDEFTLEAWVNPDELQQEMTVLARETPLTSDPYAYLLHASSTAGPPKASIGRVDQSDPSTMGPDPLPVNTWSHLALIYDGTQMTLLVDGSIVATANSPPPDVPHGGLEIGGNTFLGEYFDGTIDEIRIYSEPLGTGEVQRHMGEALESQSAQESVEKPVTLGFDQREGSIAYSFTSNHDGSIEGATWTDGKHGTALRFDGLDDKVTVSDHADLDLSSEFTIAAWVKPATGTVSGAVISKRAAGGEGYQLDLNGSGGAPRVVADNGQVTAVASDTTALPAKKWTHLAATHDGTTLRLYANGALRASATGPPPASNTQNLRVGATTAGDHFSGTVDDVSVDDDAIGPGAVPAIQRQGVAGGLRFEHVRDPITGAAYTSVPVGAVGSMVEAAWTVDMDRATKLYRLSVEPLSPHADPCGSLGNTWGLVTFGCMAGGVVPWSTIDSPPTLTWQAAVIDRHNDSRVYLRSGPISVETYVPDFEIQITGYEGPHGAVINAVSPVPDDSEAGTAPELMIKDSSGTEVELCEDVVGNITSCPLGAGTYRATVEGYGRLFGYSEWLTVDESGEITSSNADGFDALAMAQRWGNATAVCNAFLHWGTHTQGTSTSDQYNTCEAARLSNQSTFEILRALAALYGVSVLAYLQWFGENFGDPTTGVVDEGPYDPSTGATVAPPAVYPGDWEQDLGSFRQRTHGELTAARADRVFAACIAVQIAAKQCLKMPIFLSGSLPHVEPATAHARRAILKEGQPVHLRYLTASERSGRWYKRRPECYPLAAGHDCDEYPMQSTIEGGPPSLDNPSGASLAQIQSWANRSQGGSLGAFYRRCKIGPATGKKFLFVPAPQGTGMPSAGFC